MLAPAAQYQAIQTSRPGRGGQLRANLRASNLDAAAHGGMVGLGETYLIAFALAAGLGELTAGLLGSLPMVIGGTMQMLAPRAIRLLGSHKRWVVGCAVVQALAFVPLTLAAWHGTIHPTLAFVIVSVYWTMSLASGPAWNTWVGTTVPAGLRSRYFARRTRLAQMVTFAGFIAGGLALQAATTSGYVMPVFALLFAIAGTCRLVSVGGLATQSEPTPIPPGMMSIGFRDILPTLWQHRGGRLVAYLVAVQAAAQISGPYFTPFILQKLDFNYAQFIALISTAFAAKVITLSLLGRLSSKFNPKQLLWVGGVALVPISAMWLISGSMPWLLFVQVCAGVAWATYELAFFLLFFDSMALTERTAMLTVYNWINSIAFVAGALIGGAILQALGANHTAYLTIFAVSSVARGAALLLLARVPAAASHRAAGGSISLRTTSVRPNAASLDPPITASLRERTPESQAA